MKKWYTSLGIIFGLSFAPIYGYCDSESTNNLKTLIQLKTYVNLYPPNDRADIWLTNFYRFLASEVAPERNKNRINKLSHEVCQHQPSEFQKDCEGSLGFENETIGLKNVINRMINEHCSVMPSTNDNDECSDYRMMLNEDIYQEQFLLQPIE